MKKSKIVMELTAGFSAALTLACAGFHFGWASPALPKLLADDSDIPITSGESSWIVSFFTFGCAIGPLIGVVLVDRWGRKLTLLFSIIPFVVGSVFLGFAKAYWWFLVARFVVGLGSGISYTVVPMYLGEIADDEIRGALGTLITIMSNCGGLLAYSVGPWVNLPAFALVGGVLPVIFGLMFVWMPESPYFLVMKGKLDRAEKSLNRFKESTLVKDELKKVQVNVESDFRNAGTIKELVMEPGNRKALIIVIGLVLAQQFSGIGAVLAYSTLIFEASGSSLDSSISVIITGVVPIVAGLLPTFIVDLVGRRPLFLISGCGSILFLSGEALYFQLQALGTDVSGISWLPLTCIIGYSISYIVGLGSLPYVIISEIFPCNIKAMATMVASITGAFAGTAIAKLYQVVADAYGIHASFWGFAGITVLSVMFIYFVLPETKQRSLRSIQEGLRETAESKVELTNTAVA